jgi:hypothetical protein
MLRQAENRVKIEGILAEIDIKPGTFNKNGQTMESIGGSITVKVTQKISGEEKELAIPVHMFASKLTNKGTPNPAYESIKKIADEYVSIAASENGEDGADRVRITNASIRMNEYYSQDGRLISFPRVNASFVQKINKSDCKPEATYMTEFVVAQKNEEIDRNGEETGRYRIDAIIPQYGGKVDVVPMYAQSPGVIDAVKTYWEIGNTVKANGRLDFSATTETTIEEVDFGEPIEKTRTINRSDLIITGGSQEPLEGDFAFDNDEIQNALAERKLRLEKQKDRDMSRAATRQTPAPAAKHGFQDLGF